MVSSPELIKIYSMENIIFVQKGHSLENLIADKLLVTFVFDNFSRIKYVPEFKIKVQYCIDFMMI